MTSQPLTPLQIAEDCWGEAMPDWVRQLAQLSTDQTQSAAARAIGYSPGVVTAVLRNQYRADLARVEAAVRGALMAETVRCPILAEDITLDHCGRSQDSKSQDPLSEAFRKLCPTCPHSWSARSRARKTSDTPQLQMEL